MIKIFRHIRQSMINQNRTKKYLLYAIGEIILVVIGILIALQINNWNETRKENNLKDVYTSRLVSDLKKDLNTIEAIKERTKNMQTLISRFIASLDSEMSVEERISVAELYFTDGWSTIGLPSQNNTYTDLSQTGNMKVFKDTDLRELILSYYALIDNYTNGYEINKDWVVPLDVTISQETDALGFSNQTKNLYNLTDKSNAISELDTQKKLLKRHASVHFWINDDTIDKLNNIQATAENLIVALENKS